MPAPVSEVIVIELPALPEREKLFNVVVVPAVKNIVEGRPLIFAVISLNVFDPVIVSAPIPDCNKVPQVLSAPANVFAKAELIEIVLVPGKIVINVGLIIFHAVAPEPVMVQVPEPMASVFAVVEVAEKVDVVTFPDVDVRVPLDNVTAPVTFKLSVIVVVLLVYVNPESGVNVILVPVFDVPNVAAAFNSVEAVYIPVRPPVPMAPVTISIVDGSFS